jgi:hypothetical protein
MFAALFVLALITSPSPDNGKPVIRNDPSHAVVCAPSPGAVHSGKPVIRN